MRANVWIAVFSFIGNYFWTHYFYVLLGAEYTFRSWRLNDVSSCGLLRFAGNLWHARCQHCSARCFAGQRMG